MLWAFSSTAFVFNAEDQGSFPGPNRPDRITYIAQVLLFDSLMLIPSIPLLADPYACFSC